MRMEVEVKEELDFGFRAGICSIYAVFLELEMELVFEFELGICSIYAAYLEIWMGIGIG